MQGDVLYRDALENNLPGMLWLHVAVRSLLGWSSEVLRLVDLLVVWPTHSLTASVRVRNRGSGTDGIAGISV